MRSSSDNKVCERPTCVGELSNLIGGLVTGAIAGVVIMSVVMVIYSAGVGAKSLIATIPAWGLGVCLFALVGVVVSAVRSGHYEYLFVFAKTLFGIALAVGVFFFMVDNLNLGDMSQDKTTSSPLREVFGVFKKPEQD